MSSFFYILMVLLGVCLLAALWRWKKGPHAADRILIFDLATSLGCALLVLTSLLFGQAVFLDIALLLAVISFASTIGLAYWLEKGSEQ